MWACRPRLAGSRVVGWGPPPSASGVGGRVRPAGSGIWRGVRGWRRCRSEQRCWTPVTRGRARSRSRRLVTKDVTYRCRVGVGSSPPTTPAGPSRVVPRALAPAGSGPTGGPNRGPPVHRSIRPGRPILVWQSRTGGSCGHGYPAKMTGCVKPHLSAGWQPPPVQPHDGREGYPLVGWVNAETTPRMSHRVGREVLR